MVSRWLRSAMIWLALFVSSCSDKPGPQVGGESHWLASCFADHECEDPELSCVCGTCTRKCAGDSMCGGGAKAACYDPSSPLLLQRCEARSASGGGGVCLLDCRRDAECGSARACAQGACVPATQNGQPDPLTDAGADAAPGVSPDAGSDAGMAPPPPPSTHDFDDVPAGVSWSDPVALPTPSPTITGFDERFLGTWEEPRCADLAARAADEFWTCLRLTIERDASGVLTGSFDFLLSTDEDTRTWGPPGPFAAPTNPDIGWPTELAVTDYSGLASSPAEAVTYRVLDGQLDDSTLSFTWSPADVWQPWCALQTSHRWEIDGHTFQFCVPQGAAAQAGIDEGKMVLCRSAAVEPFCTSADGSWPLPCACTESVGNPRCSPAYCQCDERGCSANVGVARERASFRLDANRLIGRWTDQAEAIELVRVKP